MNNRKRDKPESAEIILHNHNLDAMFGVMGGSWSGILRHI
jgi:hypothetical protein